MENETKPITVIEYDADVEFRPFAPKVVGIDVGYSFIKAKDGEITPPKKDA